MGVAVEERQMSALPGLARALRVANRRIPVENSSELESLKAILKESNLRSTGTDFFVVYSGRIYQIELRMRAAPRVIM